MSQPNITVITQAHCTWCTTVREALSDMGLSFTICSIDHQGSTELRRFLDSQKIRTVPAVFVDGEYVGGCNETLTFFGREQKCDDQYSFGEKLDVS